ncbi:2750_t:CDS:2 [Funneliformis geosporum]|uniref:18136_t:CDS:1 n=1 Tax=Funneliformis geosporum TaxID=1117311 RepID=A0A9W4SL31_9GLOM|nr:2750_t:CDS:2 [Funneliformis geosporum]CAI2172374.1 18136_t:CDS:2 [Funneliformis geosporum]
MTNVKLQFAITALGASLATGIAIFSYQNYKKRLRAEALKREIGSIPQTTRSLRLNGTKSEIAFDETLIKEQLARNIAFLGEEGVEKLRKSFVIIVGAGGVGSWAALMLIRSGVSHIRVIDFDQVTLSSLNRHAVATHSDVGTPKVIALQKHLKEIAPWAKVEPIIELFKKDHADQLLDGNADFIVDAIDNIDTKLYLLKYCHDQNLPIISSMGAGAKADPSRIQMSDISITIEDPLARRVRRRLKKMGVESGITVVYSTEKPNVKLLPLDESQIQNAGEYATLPDFRSRILPVLGTIPAIFGMSIATYIVTKIAGHHIEPLSNKNRDGLYTRLHRDLQNRQRRIYNIDAIPLDVHEIGYIFEEIWRGKSAISGSTEKPAITRWHKDQPLCPQNCVVMTKQEADDHEKLTINPEEHYRPDVVTLVQRRFQEEKEISNFR